MPSATISLSEAPTTSNARPELRILLVEDSAPLRVRIVELLTERGVMQVAATAETEAGANALIATDNFDVLVVDVELRQGSGINVVRAARRRWTAPPLPLIIVLTNYALPTVKDRCLAAGADHFLDKMRQFDQMQPLIVARRNEIL